MTRRRTALISALLATALGFASPAAASAAPAVLSSASLSSASSLSSSAHTAVHGDGTIAIDVSPSGGGLVQQTAPTSVTVTIVNGTDEDLAAGVATLAVSGQSLTSAGELDDWLAPDAASAPQIPVGAAAVRNVDVPPLIAGQRYIASGIDLTATDLGLDAADPAGTYGLAATFIAGDVSAGGRNALVWTSDGRPANTNIAVVAPLTVPLSYGGLLDSDELTKLTSETGDLTTQLNALVGEPIAIGIDPRIIASIHALGTRVPASAQTWLERLAAASNETFALQYGDAEPSVQAQAGLTELLKPTSFDFALNVADFPVEPPEPTEEPTPSETPSDVSPQVGKTSSRHATPEPTADPGSTATGPTADPAADPASAATAQVEETSSPTPTPSPSPTTTEPAEPTVPTLEELLAWTYTIPGIVWAGGSTTEADLGVFAASGGSVTILGSSNVPATNTTPSASATVGASRVLLADTGLATNLAAAASATTAVAFDGAISELNARVSSIASEGVAGRTVLAVLPRGVDGVLPRLADTVDALRALPAAMPSTLEAAIASPPAAVSLNGRDGTSERAEDTKLLLEDEQRVGLFATVLDQPDLLTGEERATLLSTLSAGWLTDDAAWSSAVADQRKRTIDILNAVRVTDSSRINMVGGEVSLPFAVRNDLPYPVTVVMQAAPSNGRLSVAGSVTQDIAANARATVLLPVQAQIGNGDVTLRLQLYSPTGQEIGNEAFVGVNVRADWEGIGAVVLAAFVGLLFIAGIVRMVLTRRARAAAAAAPVAEPVEAPVTEPSTPVTEPVEVPVTEPSTPVTEPVEVPTDHDPENASEPGQVESSPEPKETDG
ncbi:DUF6049 family protein [Plantibacter sp. YIM 135249]|uniref:DUF6049 family protein n=1 Tax=Plantibacter sp. YIM 135249 TaxID=3423918 RepID=UPI003D346E93